MTQDIHAGAVGPTRNGLQVGGLSGALTAAATGDPVTGLGVAVAGTLLAAVGSACRASLREYEQRGTAPSFWRGLLLQVGAVLGALVLAILLSAHSALAHDVPPRQVVLVFLPPENAEAAEVSGYRLYRTPEGGMEEAIDLQLPEQSLLSSVWSSLVGDGRRSSLPIEFLGSKYDLALTAIGPGGESDRSNTLTLPAEAHEEPPPPPPPAPTPPPAQPILEILIQVQGDRATIRDVRVQRP